MNHPSSQPGYSLIELLVAVSLTVFVATLATVTLSSTTRLQAVNKQGQIVSAQIQQFQQELAQDVQLAAEGGSPKFHIVTLTGTTGSNPYPYDGLLIMSVPGRDVNGLIDPDPSLIKRVAYCAEYTASSPLKKRLTRFTMPPFGPTGDYYNPNYVPGATPVCSKNNIQNMFTPYSPPEVESLGDVGVEVLNLRFWPLYYNASPEISAIRMELIIHPSAGARSSASSEIFNYVTRTNINVSSQLKHTK